MSRFSDEQYTAILKIFYAYDSRLQALSSSLLEHALLQTELTKSSKPLEKWARAWKKCRLNIKKTYHKYGLLHASDKKDIELLFNLYLNDKSVAKILYQASPIAQNVILNIMAPRTVKLAVKHPPRGFAERIASRLATGFERIAQQEKRKWINGRE